RRRGRAELDPPPLLVPAVGSCRLRRRAAVDESHGPFLQLCLVWSRGPCAACGRNQPLRATGAGGRTIHGVSGYPRRLGSVRYLLVWTGQLSRKSSKRWANVHLPTTF